MAKNTRNTMSNKYWENEEAILTVTDFAEVHYYKEAGKIQLYSTYEDRNGERHLTKATTWDNNEMSANDAVKLAFAVMQGLLDCGVENDAFADAYALLEEEAKTLPDDNNDEDLNPYDFVATLELADAKKVAKALGVRTSRKDDPDSIADKIDQEVPEEDDLVKVLTELGYYDSDDADEEDAEDETDDDDEVEDDDNEEDLTDDFEDDDDDEESEDDDVVEFVGKKITYKDGEVAKATKRVKNAYVENANTTIEFVNDEVVGFVDELKAMPTKTKRQMEKQNKRYEEIQNEISEFCDAMFSGKADRSKANDLMVKFLRGADTDETIVGLLAIIDGAKF